MTGFALTVSPRLFLSITMSMIQISFLPCSTYPLTILIVPSSNPNISIPLLETLILIFNNLDLDPDLKMLTSNSYLLSKCAYMSSRQFNRILSDNSNSNCFSLFHLNSCTLKKHSTLNTSFSTIGLSATWLNTTSNDLYNYWNRRWG